MTFLTLDLQTKKWLLAFLLCLFFWWVLGSAGTCSAGNVQRTYTVTEAELQALENRLETLNQISQTQQQESKRLKDTLATSKQELTMLRSQLNTSTEQLKQAQESLANANKSLQEFANEEKRTRLRIKRQRNFWIVTTITAIVVAVTSHN